MNVELKLDCDKCGIEDITLDMTIKGKITPSFKDISSKGKEQGWHIGRNCYCPACNRTITTRCNTCEYYEGNKSMGSPICRRDGEFATPLDSCEYHKSF